MSQAHDLEFFGAFASCIAQGQNLTAVVMPQFAYKKGQLYMASRAVEDVFINRGLPIDVKWAIPFKTKCDSRDSRPLVYDGRLVVPAGIKECDFVFKNTPMMHGRTEMAEMMPASKMKVIEDVCETSVPSMTDLDGTVRGHRSTLRWGRTQWRRSWTRPRRISSCLIALS